MAKDNQIHNWNGKTVLEPHHVNDLDHHSALLEFGEGKTRQDAETEAYRLYTTKHHTEAAAHHLSGMQRARGNGDIEEAKKHGLAYGLHMAQLGHKATDEVPEEIRLLSNDVDSKQKVKFKVHKADKLLLSQPTGNPG
jgi:hypothetical protein